MGKHSGRPIDLPTTEQLANERRRLRYKSKYNRTLRSTVAILVVVAALAVLIATLWMPVLRIYGSSMSPTLHDGQIVVSIKSTRFEPGDIAAFYHGNKLLIKRYIAGPGQWVDIDVDGNIKYSDICKRHGSLREGGIVMRNRLPDQAVSYTRTHIRKKKWRRVVTVLSCIVVFCTTYALILPALTMTQQTFCGIEAHTHEPDSCYERVLICGQETADGAASEQTAHVHTDACYQEAQQLICGLAEGEGAHLHTADCFDEAGTLICGLDESFGHQHMDRH